VICFTNFFFICALCQHRRELPLIAGCLDDIGRNHQQATRRHYGLSVVALLEAAACNRHDARLFVGQIDLIGRLGTIIGLGLNRYAVSVLRLERSLSIPT
jgi:hypothetical protein